MNMQTCHERYGRSTFVNARKHRLDETHPGTFVRYGPGKLLINSNHGLQGKLVIPSGALVSNWKLYC